MGSEIAEVQREFERRRAEAQAEIAALGATCDACDEALIRQWAVEPATADDARTALQQARETEQAEDFDRARAGAQSAREALEGAMRSAVENESAHDLRNQIGDTIMDALEELGFEVSYEEGDRSDPMRIAGQTPDEAGRGDIDIELPLDGKVDFEVTAGQGDTTCVAAIKELERRLEQQGIQWQTTDWGHAENAGPVTQTQVKQQVKRKTKRKTRT